MREVDRGERTAQHQELAHRQVRHREPVIPRIARLRTSILVAVAPEYFRFQIDRSAAFVIADELRAFFSRSPIRGLSRAHRDELQSQLFLSRQRRADPNFLSSLLVEN